MKPQLTPEMEQLAKDSGLHLVECGGFTVGMRTEPKLWLLRPTDELENEKRKTAMLKQIASASIILSMCEDLPISSEVLQHIENWRNRNIGI